MLIFFASRNINIPSPSCCCCTRQAEQYKQAAVISSSGDSQAAEMISKAFQEVGDGLLELRRLEAAEEIAVTLSQSRNIVYLPTGAGGSNLLLNVPT